MERFFVPQVTTITVTPFAQKCRIIGDLQSKNAVVIDPGGEAERIYDELGKRKLACGEIWLTHSHLDHCGGVAKLKQLTGAVLRGHPIEASMRAHVEDLCKMYGIPAGDMRNCPEPDHMMSGGETLSFAGIEFKCFFTPGHSPGHVVFYSPKMKTLFAGDTVFQGSIGRTDLPGGDYETLMASIRDSILVLPDDTKILPGHGEDTTVGEEKRQNIFLQGD